jgi:hypothetical protein
MCPTLNSTKGRPSHSLPLIQVGHPSDEWDVPLCPFGAGWDVLWSEWDVPVLAHLTVSWDIHVSHIEHQGTSPISGTKGRPSHSLPPIQRCGGTSFT